MHLLLLLLAVNSSGYELTGQIEPPATVAVSLQSATTPFETSTVSDMGGHFRFRKLSR